MEDCDVIGGAVRRVYAGIGSRQTILRVMAGVAVRLALADVALRSGGAEGADTAFEWGCDQVDQILKQIFLPWPGLGAERRRGAEVDPVSDIVRLVLFVWWAAIPARSRASLACSRGFSAPSTSMTASSPGIASSERRTSPRNVLRILNESSL